MTVAQPRPRSPRTGALARPTPTPPATGRLDPQVRETHSGVVVLIGERAYKIKKAVDLGFLDFRTPQARERSCRREIELNRRLAPDVYEGLGTFAAPDGSREPVVVMRRMPDDLRLATLLERGADVEDQLRALARLMATFHSGAERGPLIAAEGGPAGLWRRWTANLRETERFSPSVLDADLYHRIRRLALRYVDGRGPLLTQRAEAGLSVDGHGDLVAEDVFCLPDGPRVLDCLEFDDRLRYVDVLDDVAFLAMDVERLAGAELSARFLRWYAEFSATPELESLSHHYIAYRAFVRAKVACIRASQGVVEASAAAQRYAHLALHHLEAGEIRLVLVGGAPGTGKTTVAGALADRLGFVLLSSDRIRRDMPGDGGETVEDRYSADRRDGAYRELLHQARRALEHGESVVADATWGAAAWRRDASELAVATASRLIQLECVAPVELAAQRAETRRAGGRDLSEAGGSVARSLAAHRDPWPGAGPIDTSGLPDDALAVAVEKVQAQTQRH